MAKALLICSSQCQPYFTISTVSQSKHDSCTIDRKLQQQTALDRIYIKFNKRLFIVCFPQIRNNPNTCNKTLTRFGSFMAAKYRCKVSMINEHHVQHMNTALHLQCCAVFMHQVSRSMRCSRERASSRHVFF